MHLEQLERSKTFSASPRPWLVGGGLLTLPKISLPAADLSGLEFCATDTL